MNFKTKNKIAQGFAAVLILVLSFAMFATGHVLQAAVLLSFGGMVLNAPRARLCAVTLSVPEILADVLHAFKLRTPELFGPGGFGTDFSSKTAVLGDTVTAKIEHTPVTAAYDPNPGKGFYNGAQDVTTLIEDVPVILNQFRHVPIKIGWLTQLSSKLPLYQRAISNYGWALGKYVVDTCLAQITAGNFSSSVQTALANLNLDTFDGNIRNQMNTNKAFDTGRYCILNTPAASALGSDDRVRSNLFFGALNGNRGYRLWQNIAGFGLIREYPDFPTAGNLYGIGADSRAIVVASRRPDYSNVAEQLGVPKVMDFYPLMDEESGLFITGVAWQEVGTGDVYVSAAVLFGVAAGKQGGANGAITDAAGVRLTT